MIKEHFEVDNVKGRTMSNWYRRWQARRTFSKMIQFHYLNQHKFNATENAYFVLSMDQVRSIMYKDYIK